VAFGVAWWRDSVCSAGFDGQVLCTSADGVTQQVLSSTAHARWLVSSPDRKRLVLATTDGKIQSFDGASSELYNQGALPYRMAFSTDGAFLASGGDDGSIVMYDVAGSRIESRTNAHRGRVLSVVWRGHDLWTAGADGAMIHWSHVGAALVPLERRHEAGSFRFLQLLPDGWIGNVDSRSLLVNRRSNPEPLRLDLGRRLAQLELSPDGRYIAATVAGEIVVLDLDLHRLASLGIASDGIGYVGFAGTKLLAISTANGLFSLRMDELDYTLY
jgi:WD40 repeat protein